MKVYAIYANYGFDDRELIDLYHKESDAISAHTLLKCRMPEVAALTIEELEVK